VICQLGEGKMNKFYPFCLNSKRWLTVMFFMNLPKSCPNEAEKECEYEKCAYYELKKPTSYLLKMIKIMKLYGMDIISAEEKRVG